MSAYSSSSDSSLGNIDWQSRFKSDQSTTEWQSVAACLNCCALCSLVKHISFIVSAVVGCHMLVGELHSASAKTQQQ